MTMKSLYRIALLFVLAAFKPAENKPRIFLIGDSTCANKPANAAPETGWGMALPDYLIDGVEVQNHAVNGRSTKSFRTEGRWQKVMEQLRPGDFVLIQFGHNDQKTEDTTRYAAPQTDYRKNLIRYAEEAKSKGATPVLLTPVMRRKFDASGQFVDQHGEYPGVVRAIAKEYKLPLIDLHATSREVIVQHGVEGSKELFMHLPPKMYPRFPDGKIDDTHFSGYGAAVIAALVADGFRSVAPLAGLLKPSVFPGKYVYELPKTVEPVFRKDTFNIVRFGAKADGLTINSKAINQAIDACTKAGGGTVLIPKGLWLTGPVVLQSNVNLHLEKGALLQFSENYDEYPLVKTSWEGQEAIRCQSPVSAENARHIAITGAGIIDGAGQVWRAVKKEKMTANQWKKLVASGGVLDESQNMWYPTESSLKGSKIPRAGQVAAGYTIESAKEFKNFLRPNMVRLTNCSYILLEGVTFQNSPAWNLHPMLCNHITLRNVSVRNPWYAQNGDGVDFESCRNGLVDNCTFDVGDDGICIKSGRDEEGRKRGVPTENFIVRNSTVYHAHGGFVIGSEMSGGVKNLYVSNCNFLGTDVGLRFKTARGRGGVVEKIYVTDINMTDIPGEAILFDMYYMAKDPVPQPGESNDLPAMEAQPLNEGTPQFRDFHIRNVVCQGAETGILIRGLPEMSIKDIDIENAVLEANKGLVCIEAENIRLKNITLMTKEKTVMKVQNSKNITLDQINYKPGADLVLKVMGDRSKAIRLLNTDASKAKKEVEFGSNALSTVVTKK